MALKNSDFLTGAYIIEHSPVLIVPVNNNKHKKDTVIPNLLSFLHMQKISENKFPTTFPLLLLIKCQTAGQFASQSMHRHYRVFSHDVTAAILVSQNNETAAMLVSQTSPLGVELFSYANALFCYNEFAYMLATWVKTLCKNMMKT